MKLTRYCLFMLLILTGQYSIDSVTWAATQPKKAFTPLIHDAKISANHKFEIVFDSRFDSSDGLQPDLQHWRREDMGKSNNAGQHRQAESRRHAAWYDAYPQETAFIRDGTLVQRGFIADKDIPNFVSRDAGKSPRNFAYDDPDPRDEAKGSVNFADFEFHTSWFDTFAVKSVDGKQVPVQTDDELLPKGEYWGQPGKTDTLSPNITFSPGTYFEIEVNFEGMQALAHRHSFWLMPAMQPGAAYDSDPANGLEIDIYEHELVVEPEQAASMKPNPNDVLLMKCIGGATSPSATQNELRDDWNTQINVPGINSGWHKIGLLWTRDEIVWFVDGEAMVRDTQLVPQVDMFLILSREANTGAVDPTTVDPRQLKASPPKIPLDPGIYGRNAATPANRALIKDGKDEVKVRSVQAWKISQ